MSAKFYAVGGREVREIPQGWQHPRDDRGRHVPLLPHDYWSDEPVDNAAHRGHATVAMNLHLPVVAAAGDQFLSLWPAPATQRDPVDL